MLVFKKLYTVIQQQLFLFVFAECEVKLCSLHCLLFLNGQFAIKFNDKNVFKGATWEKMPKKEVKLSVFFTNLGWEIISNQR